jgi:hypothetical protein
MHTKWTKICAGLLAGALAACGGGGKRSDGLADAMPDGPPLVRMLADQTPACAGGVQGVVGLRYTVPPLLHGLEMVGPETGATVIVAAVTFGASTPLFVHTAAGREAIDRTAANTLLEHGNGLSGEPNAVVVFAAPVLAYHNRPGGWVLVAQAAEVTLFPPDGKQLQAPPMCTGHGSLVEAGAAATEVTGKLHGAAPTAQATYVDVDVDGGTAGPPHLLRAFLTDARIFERTSTGEVALTPAALVGRQLRVRHTVTVLEFDRLSAVAAEIEAL